MKKKYTGVGVVPVLVVTGLVAAASTRAQAAAAGQHMQKGA